MKLSLRLSACLISFGLLLPVTNLFAKGSDPNVILLMMDGVRWQELFHGTDPDVDGHLYRKPIFENLLHTMLSQGVSFGDRDAGSEMQVSNPVYISLPAYHSIMAGYNQYCYTNICGRISVETVQERLVRELKLDKKDVATIASWGKIAHSVEHVEGTTFVNSGNKPFPDDQDPDTVTLNRAQAKDSPPWGGSRWDKYTFAHGIKYLKKVQPRFLYLSLGDSDEWAHHNNYLKYVATLTQYDAWIKELINTLDQMGEYGKNTTLLITTDHGRGTGKVGWQHHGLLLPDSKNIWLYGQSPYTRFAQGPSAVKYTHTDIRPTIEISMGIKPQTCSGCGRIIKEIVGPKS